MCNLFFCFLKFHGNLIEQASHGFLSVEHGPGLFITSNVVLNLLLQFLVNLFVIQNWHETLINFSIQDLVLVGQFKVIFSQLFPLDNWLIEFALSQSECVLKTLQFHWEILVAAHSAIKVRAKLLILVLSPITLLFKFSCLFLQLFVLVV